MSPKKKSEALEQLLTLRNNNLYRFYEPCGKVAEFIQRVGTETEKNVWLFLGGNGANKTGCGVNIIANICFPEKNKYFQFPFFQKYSYIKNIRIASDPTTISTVIIPEIEKWFPKGRYEMLKKGKQYVSEIKTDTGFTLNVMTYEQDKKEFESANIGFTWLDEPPPEKLWGAITSRLRLGGKILVGMTPLAEGAYLYDKYVLFPEPDKEGIVRSGYEFVSIWDNTKGVGVRGFLDKEQVELTIANYPEEQLEARVEGKFQHLSGLIYPEFMTNRKIYEISYDHFGPNGIPKDWTRIEAIDYHKVIEQAVTFMAISPEGVCYTYDEIFQKFNSYKDFCDAILQKRKGIQPRITIIEPQANEPSNLDHGKVPRNEIIRVSDHKIIPVIGSKKRDAGIMLFHEKLKLDVQGHAGWYIVSSRCPRTMKELLHYRRENDKIIKEYDHMMENHHRIFLSGIGYKEKDEHPYFKKQRPRGKYY